MTLKSIWIIYDLKDIRKSQLLWFEGNLGNRVNKIWISNTRVDKVLSRHIYIGDFKLFYLAVSFELGLEPVEMGILVFWFYSSLSKQHIPKHLYGRVCGTILWCAITMHNTTVHFCRKRTKNSLDSSSKLIHWLAGVKIPKFLSWFLMVHYYRKSTENILIRT